MPDGDEVVVPVEKVEPLLTDSKLYELARAEPLLTFLIPEFMTQAAVEIELEDIFPREEADGLDTRILINYTNIKNRAMIFKVVDPDRTLRRFDIDGFMDGYTTALHEGNAAPDIDAVKMLEMTILSALNMSAATAIGLNDGPNTKHGTKVLSEVVLASLTAILFDDALDVMISLKDQPLQAGNDTHETRVVGLWTVRTRENVALAKEAKNDFTESLEEVKTEAE